AVLRPELHLDLPAAAGLPRLGLEADDELQVGVCGGKSRRVDRVEDAEDIELAFARNVRVVGQEREADAHARPVCQRRRARARRASAFRSGLASAPWTSRGRVRPRGWRATPRSVTTAVTSSFGVTSN